MKIYIPLLLLTIAACNSKPKEPTAEELINNMSAPLIANEVGDLNILVKTIQDPNAPFEERDRATAKICDKFPEYMCQAVDINQYMSDEEFVKMAYNGKRPKNKFPYIDTTGHYKARKLILDSLSSDKFNHFVTLQTALIEKKYKQQAAQALDKAQLEKKYESTKAE